MKYRKAEDILPQELLKQIQYYIQGEILYIPNKKGHKKKWGECSGGRSYLAMRNAAIKEAYASGESCEALASSYHLSLASIRKIVYGSR